MKKKQKKKAVPTSIKIGELKDKKSLKSRLNKRALENKQTLHKEIVSTLEKSFTINLQP